MQLVDPTFLTLRVIPGDLAIHSNSPLTLSYIVSLKALTITGPSQLQYNLRLDLHHDLQNLSCLRSSCPVVETGTSRIPRL